MFINRHYIPLVFTVLGFVLLCSLGSWQVYRLTWKNDLIDRIKQGVLSDPVPLPASVSDVSAMRYKKIRVEGQYMHDKEIHLYTGPRRFKGKPGYSIITPLLRHDGTVVLVDRGWVPAENKKRSTRLESVELKSELVEGILVPGESKRFYVPDNDVERNLWFWVDIPFIASYLGKDIEPYYIRKLGEYKEGRLPIPGDYTIRIRNDHLQYAITWYCLSIILVVIYFVYRYKESSSVTKRK